MPPSSDTGSRSFAGKVREARRVRPRETITGMQSDEDLFVAQRRTGRYHGGTRSAKVSGPIRRVIHPRWAQLPEERVMHRSIVLLPLVGGLLLAGCSSPKREQVKKPLEWSEGEFRPAGTIPVGVDDRFARPPDTKVAPRPKPPI